MRAQHFLVLLEFLTTFYFAHTNQYSTGLHISTLAPDLSSGRGKSAAMCRQAGCTKRKAYGDPTTRVVETCSRHKEPHYMNLMTRKCSLSACNKYASFKEENQAFCALHKPANATDFRSSTKVCRFPECRKQASYGQARPLWCREHMNVSVDVDVKNRKCSMAGCSQRACYGDASSTERARCSRHKLKADVRIRFGQNIVVKVGCCDIDSIRMPSENCSDVPHAASARRWTRGTTKSRRKKLLTKLVAAYQVFRSSSAVCKPNQPGDQGTEDLRNETAAQISPSCVEDVEAGQTGGRQNMTDIALQLQRCRARSDVASCLTIMLQACCNHSSIQQVYYSSCRKRAISRSLPATPALRLSGESFDLGAFTFWGD
eukprot:763026-Hanusia_phi.AAC.6